MPDDVQVADPEPAPMIDEIPVSQLQRKPIFEQVSGPVDAPARAPLPALRHWTPPESFNDPAYQQRIEAEQMKMYRQASSVKEAEAAVFSARKMLGVLKADREIRSGTPVDKAMYQNLQFFVNPADKGFSGTMKVLRPPPQPYVTNFPGIPAPAVIDSGGRPHWMPQSARPPGPEAVIPKEVKAIPVIDPKSGEPVGFVRPDAKGRLVNVPAPKDAKTTLDPLSRIDYQTANQELKTVRSQLLKEQSRATSLFGAAGGPRKDVVKQLQGREKELMSDIDRMRGQQSTKGKAATPIPSGIMLRRKKDGAQFRYKGDVNDVPADQYDVVK